MNFIMLCGSVHNVLKVDVVCVLSEKVIVVLLLKESVVIKGLTVQQLAVIHEKPLPVDMVPFYWVDVLLKLLYREYN